MGKKGGGNEKSQQDIQAEIQMNRERNDAYTRQAEIALRAAEVQSNAQLQAAKMQADASIQASKSAAVAGIAAAALGQHTTTEEIIRRLPVESGAATIASWELAQQWDKERQMTIQGYQGVAIDYQQSGKKFNSLYSDATYTSMVMGQKIKDTALSAASIIGIQSAQNPNGVPMTWDQFKMLNSLKKPEDMLKVDPAVASQRKAAYEQWKAANPMIAKLYENPQLAGQSIEGMAGEKSAINPELAAILSSVDPNIGKAIGSAPKAEKGQYEDQIAQMKKMGIIDANNMINGGELLKMVPEGLRNAPEFSPYRELSQSELIQLQDTYNAGMNKVYDPKLIKIQDKGFGVRQTTVLNPDGSVAHSFMSGDLMLADGTMIKGATLSGTRLQEWYDFQSLADGMGPTFPGMFAPRSNQELEGIRTHKNGLATAATGEPGQPGSRTASTPKLANFAENMYAQQNQLGGAERTPKPAASSSSAPAEGGQTVGTLGKSLTSSKTPAGYEGAPLAAGE